MNPEDIRRFYSEEIRVVANLRSPELVKAFAKAPRENFLGDGPWSYATSDILTGGINYRETESIADSCCLHGEAGCLSALALTESAENAKRD
jgi:hypothetical protein